MKTSPSPALMAWAAIRMDCRLEEQNRLMVSPGTLNGKPARMPAVRAMEKPVSPCWATFPQMMLDHRSLRDCGHLVHQGVQDCGHQLVGSDVDK